MRENASRGWKLFPFQTRDRRGADARFADARVLLSSGMENGYARIRSVIHWRRDQDRYRAQRPTCVPLDVTID